MTYIIESDHSSQTLTTIQDSDIVAVTQGTLSGIGEFIVRGESLLGKGVALWIRVNYVWLLWLHLGQRVDTFGAG